MIMQRIVKVKVVGVVQEKGRGTRVVKDDGGGGSKRKEGGGSKK